MCCLQFQPGSMADVPKDLLAEIRDLENLFTVSTEKLKAITSHFVKELEKGKLILAAILTGN